MELEQFGIIKKLLEEIRDILKEQNQKSDKQLLVEEQKTFGSPIESRCACGKLSHELCDRAGTTNGCLRNIGINIL